MICKQCGTTIADKAIVCYRCGTATTDPVRKPLGDQSLTGATPLRPTRRSGWPLLAALAILFLLAVYAALTPELGVPPIIAGIVAAGAAILLLVRLLRR